MPGSTNTPVSTHPAQSTLRTDPNTAFTKNGYCVTSDTYQNTTMGGPCAVDCKSANGAVYNLRAKQGYGDWFFPYVHVTSGGVGVCIVPVGQPDGTTAITGGMNGCALQVNRFGAEHYFYHDANGVSMAGKLTPGEIVCRVPYKDYAGSGGLGEKLSVDFTTTQKNGKGAMVHEYYLITVRSGGRWNVYCSALLRTSIRKTAFWSGKDYNDITFAPFMPTYSRLITSFPDS